MNRTVNLLLVSAGLSSFSAHAINCDPSEFLTLTVDKRTVSVSDSRLSELPQRTITTSTYWANKGSYKGPLLQDVIAMAAAPEASKLTIYSWDNYKAEIPVSDLSKYGVILATSFNDERLKLDDWGPMFIMYPYDKHKELHRPAGLKKMIWQVCRIELS